MQCLQLADLPWKDEFPEVDSIVVVLTAPVLREVDRQKGGQGRLAKRARAVNSLIGKLIDAPTIDLSKGGKSPSVSVISADQIRPDPELHDTLDYSQPDNAIVGTAAAFQKVYADERVKILSNDNIVLLTARRVSVPFHRVPAAWLLPAESDEDQKKIKSLENEIKRLKDHEPVCIIEPKDTPWNFTIETFEPLNEQQIQSLLAEIQRRFPEAIDFGPRESSIRNGAAGSHGLLAQLGKEEFVPATQDEVAKYQQELYPQWITKCEVELREIHRKLEKRRPAPRIAVTLLNNGSRPAEDLKVSFTVLGGGILIQLPAEEDNSTKSSAVGNQQIDSELYAKDISLPRPPAAPKGHWKKVTPFNTIERMAAFSGSGRRVELLGGLSQRRPPPIPQIPESDSFYWKMGTRPTYPRISTELTCQQWRHRSSPEEFEFELAWLDNAKARNGALHIEVHAANLTDPATKIVSIELSAKAGDTWREAKALVDFLDDAGERFGLTKV